MLAIRLLSAKFAAVSESVDAAQIGVGPREAMRNALASAKARIDELDKAAKAATAGLVMEEARQLCQAGAGDFIVNVFNAGSNAKALNTALKEIEKSLPTTAVMALTLDTEANRLLCLAQVPNVSFDVMHSSRALIAK